MTTAAHLTAQCAFADWLYLRTGARADEPKFTPARKKFLEGKLLVLRFDPADPSKCRLYCLEEKV